MQCTLALWQLPPLYKAHPPTKSWRKQVAAFLSSRIRKARKSNSHMPSKRCILSSPRSQVEVPNTVNTYAPKLCIAVLPRDEIVVSSVGQVQVPNNVKPHTKRFTASFTPAGAMTPSSRCITLFIGWPTVPRWPTVCFAICCIINDHPKEMPKDKIVALGNTAR